MSNRITWEYIAGFTDGEGHIGMTPNSAKAKGIGGANIDITLSQSGPEGLEVLSDIKVFLAQHEIHSYLAVRTASRGKVKSTRQMYALKITGKQHVKVMLRALCPHLRVKRVVAFDLLRYLILNPSLHGMHLNYQDARALYAKRMENLWDDRGVQVSGLVFNPAHPTRKGNSTSPQIVQ